MLNNLDLPPLEPGGTIVNEPPPQAAPPLVEANFTESSSVFQELREFGENLVGGVESPAAPIVIPPEPSVAPRDSTLPNVNNEECLMTAGEQLPGFRIDAYLAPLSAASALNLAGGDPLRAAFDVIWAQAQALGANGVVGLRWAMTPDASKVLLSGTPVRVTKLA